MKTTSYSTEFPDYGALPALVAARLAAGQLIDLSWHNDACPSFATPKGNERINAKGDCAVSPVLWVDYADPMNREIECASRFLVAYREDATPFDTEADALAKLDSLESLPDPVTLAREFAKVLRQWLTVEEMTAVIALNHTPRYGKGICASHDFCDANMAMLEAWKTLSSVEQDADSEVQAVVWSAAWNIAKASEFATTDTKGGQAS